MTPEKTKSRKSIYLGVLSLVACVMPYIDAYRWHFFPEYDYLLVLFLYTSIAAGILAVITGCSSKSKIGVVLGGMGTGVSLFLFLGMLLMALCSLGSRHRPLYQMEMLSSATQKYCEQNEGYFPDVDAWCDQLLQLGENIEEVSLETFAGNYGLSLDPDEKRSGFAFNNKLDGRRISEIDRQTVLLFESDLGWNQNGTSDILLHKGRWVLWPFIESGNSFVFVGPRSTFTVKFVKKSEIDSLNWEPAE